MAPKTENDKPMTAPSPWVARFLSQGGTGGTSAGEALDLAAGGGRHSLLLLKHGYRVLAVDRDISALERLPTSPRLTVERRDLEGDDRDWPPAGRRFDAIVVTNYLFRPLLARLPSLLAPDGLLVYETFSQDNARFGRPSNPDFLLRPGELLDACHPALRVLAYEDLIVDTPRPAAIQRIAARKSSENGKT